MTEEDKKAWDEYCGDETTARKFLERALQNAFLSGRASRDNEVIDLRGAIERLGSSETFIFSFMKKGNFEGKELLARMRFARAFLEKTNES